MIFLRAFSISVIFKTLWYKTVKMSFSERIFTEVNQQQVLSNQPFSKSTYIQKEEYFFLGIFKSIPKTADICHQKLYYLKLKILIVLLTSNVKLFEHFQYTNQHLAGLHSIYTQHVSFFCEFHLILPSFQGTKRLTCQWFQMTVTLVRKIFATEMELCVDY